MGAGRDRLRGQQRQRRDLHRRGAAGPARLHRHRPDRRGACSRRSPAACTGAPTRPASPSPAARSPRSARCWPTPRAAGPCSTWSAPRSARSRTGAARWTGPRSARATSSWPCPARACTATATRWPAGPSARAPAELADALLAPTRVYVRAAEALWAAGVTPRGLAHISGGGLLNLARLAADVSYTLDALPPAPEIFALIAVGGRRPGRDHVRHLQHGHRLLRRRLPGRRPGRAAPP